MHILRVICKVCIPGPKARRTAPSPPSCLFLPLHPSLHPHTHPLGGGRLDQLGEGGCLPAPSWVCCGVRAHTHTHSHTHTHTHSQVGRADSRLQPRRVPLQHLCGADLSGSALVLSSLDKSAQAEPRLRSGKVLCGRLSSQLLSQLSLGLVRLRPGGQAPRWAPPAPGASLSCVFLLGPVSARPPAASLTTKPGGPRHPTPLTPLHVCRRLPKQTAPEQVAVPP